MGHGDTVPNVGFDLCEDVGHTVPGTTRQKQPNSVYLFTHSFIAYYFSEDAEINTWSVLLRSLYVGYKSVWDRMRLLPWRIGVENVDHLAVEPMVSSMTTGGKLFPLALSQWTSVLAVLHLIHLSFHFPFLLRMFWVPIYNIIVSIRDCFKLLSVKSLVILWHWLISSYFICDLEYLMEHAKPLFPHQ